MARTFLRSLLVASVVGAMLVSCALAQDGANQSRLPATVSPIEVIPDAGDGALDVRLTNSAPRFETSAALLYLQPSSGNLVYSTLINPFPFLTPNWSEQAVRPGLSPAFNVGMRYVFGSGGDVQLNWTCLNSFHHASAQANTTTVVTSFGTFTQQALGPAYLIGPPPPFTSASAVAHFLYNAVNLDSGLLLSVGNRVQTRVFAGLQGAYIGHGLSTNFMSPDGSIVFTNDSRSSFGGVGPRLGMDMHYTAGRLDFLGGIAGTTLIGGMQSHIDFSTTSPMNAAVGLTRNAQSLTSPNTTRVIPGLDAKLGASYTIPVGGFGAFRCEAGYQAAVYVSAINQFSLTEVGNSLTAPSEGTQAVFLRTAVASQSNFTAHGPYASFSLQF